MSVEGIWIGEVCGPWGWENRGIFVFENGRIVGGDNRQYTMGSYEVSGDRLTAELTIHSYGRPGTFFGERSEEANVQLVATVKDDTIDGLVSGVEAVGGIDRRRCRQAVESRFSMERMARDHELFYRSVLGAGVSSCHLLVHRGARKRQQSSDILSTPVGDLHVTGDGVQQVPLRCEVVRHASQGWADGLQVGWGREGVADLRVVGADVDGDDRPPGVDQPGDGCRTDPAGGSGDEGDGTIHG